MSLRQRYDRRQEPESRECKEIAVTIAEAGSSVSEESPIAVRGRSMHCVDATSLKASDLE
jgi:surfactin synthase thioesterase subunit